MSSLYQYKQFLLFTSQKHTRFNRATKKFSLQSFGKGFIFFTLLSFTLPCSATPPKGYVLAFKDDFNSKKLDNSHWTIEKGKRRDAKNSSRSVSLENGHLILKTFTENGKHFTGFVGSQGKFEQVYGYWEAKIRFFTSPGMWSAFWILSPTIGHPLNNVEEAGAEIDVMEHRFVNSSGKDVSRTIPNTIHWNGYGKNHQSCTHQTTWKGINPLQGKWHIYAVLWTPKSYVFFVDGKKMWSTEEAVSHRPEFIYLTSEIKDKGWAGSIPKGGYGDLKTSKTRMEIDWVKVWKPKP